MNKGSRYGWALLGVLVLGSLQGCASIVSGHLQAVSVETPGCDAARCELSNDRGKWFVSSTPGSVTIERSYNNLQVVCTKGSITSTPVSVASTTKAMAFGNILFGGIIGAGVDVGTGAAYDYPQTVSVPMQCGPEAVAAHAASAASAPRLGLRVVRAPGEGAQGLLVMSVDPGMAAEKAGLKPGDIILSANGSALPEPETLAAIIAALREPWVLDMLVRGQGVESVRRITSSVHVDSSALQPRRED